MQIIDELKLNDERMTENEINIKYDIVTVKISKLGP